MGRTHWEYMRYGSVFNCLAILGFGSASIRPRCQLRLSCSFSVTLSFPNPRGLFEQRKHSLVLSTSSETPSATSCFPPLAGTCPDTKGEVDLFPCSLSTSLPKKFLSMSDALIFCDTPLRPPVVHPLQPFPRGLSPP